MPFQNRHIGWQCALVAAAWLTATAAGGRAETLSQRLLANAAGGRTDQWDFPAASLIASGVENSRELEAWLALYRVKRSEVLAAAAVASGPNLAAALHAELHERVLTGRYRADATDLRLALDAGDYNCVSSLALYYDLCQAANIAVEIRLRRGHVYIRLLDQAPPLVVEPGTPGWLLRPDERPARTDRVLSPIELLGKFFYNRGVEQLEQGRFEAGLALLETSAQLDPDDADARSNLLAGINNWAVALFRDRRYDQAAELIARGLSRDAEFAPLVANERLVRAVLGK